MSIPKKNSKTDSSHDLVLKVIIIGDSGVGKTNILTRYCEGIFKDSYVATIGVDFKIKMVDL
jgi:Ras-related protein Rab-8A